MKYSGLIILLSLIHLGINAQEKNNSSWVKPVFFGTRLVDQQTAQTTKKGNFNIEILHRFGSVENGISDLFGVYAPSNISMGLNYGLGHRFDIGFQTEKNNKVQEFGVKYRILCQNIERKNSISLSYYFSVGIDAHDEEYFGQNYVPTDRILYSNQLIASHQINYKWHILASLNYIHFNSVDSIQYQDVLELNTAIAYKLNHKRNVFVSYQHPWGVGLFEKENTSKSNPLAAICFGFESVTPSHNFQIFLTTRNNIIPGKDAHFNSNNIALKNLCLGFNIRVKLGRK